MKTTLKTQKCSLKIFKKGSKMISVFFLIFRVRCTCMYLSCKHVSTPKLRYNESRYSEFRDIVNKCQLPLLLTKSRYSEFRDIVNKRSLTRSFVISKFGCMYKYNFGDGADKPQLHTCILI